jgi:hypothetical protein
MKRPGALAAHGAETARFEPVDRQHQITPVGKAFDPGSEVDLDVSVLAIQAGTAVHYQHRRPGPVAARPEQQAANRRAFRVQAGEVDGFRTGRRCRACERDAERGEG